jgi:alpha-glucosidase
VTLWVREVRTGGDGVAEAVPLDDPTLVLCGPLPPLEAVAAPGPGAAELRERFAFDGSTFLFRVPFPEGTSYYGTGERAGPLERTRRLALCWNTDAWCYGDESPALYQSQPAVLAVHPDGAATLVVALTARRTSIAIGTGGVEFAVERAPCAVAELRAAHPAAAVAGLSTLIGRPARVPLWALGYHQCRWSYESADEVRALAAEFDARDLPLAAIWFDIDYMDRHRIFTWDAERFPDPEELVEELRERDLRTVAVIDPGVAIAADYAVSRSGLDGGHFVLDAAGRPVEGRVWPGRCHFPDFSRPETRAWWANEVQAFVEHSRVSGLWCDMNEPAVFGTPTRTLPEDARHRGCGGGDHGRFHNLYGQWMCEATRAGLLAARPDKLPFVLTRAAHLATPRSAATWTGDNQSRWEDLRWSVSMVLALGLVGQPLCGPDVGGFHGDPGPELFARWFELGCYLPFFRGHADRDSPRKEPWSYGPEAEARVRLSLRWRMRLLPYLQACFERASQDGVPVARPLFLADPVDPRLRAVDDSFLLGDDLLVAPALQPGQAERRLHLPGNGPWYPVPVVELANDEEELVETRERVLDGPPLEGTVTIPTPAGPAPCFLRAGRQLPLAPAANRPPTSGWSALEVLTTAS